ncbi:hypothetical protein EIP91_004958 [Steccherinum ochraceum]|uniref:BTB domain-containing protein n=1 Tax=Steccherinum ochraceum TaxID=92696 RepID=A0A4R0RE07_9APHY|nr:hypothetical protein EIP91_004958 [Steccherinum ochraceum]
MSSEASTLKRQRTESYSTGNVVDTCGKTSFGTYSMGLPRTDTLILPPFMADIETRHPDLWFEDGSVILSAKDTLFRVYKGILCDASPVFRDLFTVPQPPDREMMEGCPVIRLNDSEEDMENFLKVLFQGIRAMRTVEGPVAASVYWPITRALIRLGDKYQVDELLEEGKERLQARLPGTLAAWDELYYPHGIEDDEDVWPDSVHAIAMANLASQHNMAEVHVRALYRCTLLEPATLVGGCPGPEGTREYLSPPDLARCMAARTALVKWDVLMRFNLLSTPQKLDCCPRGYKKIRILLTDYDHLMSDLSMPLDFLGRASWVRRRCEEAHLCTDCTELYMNAYSNTRQAMFSELRIYMGIYSNQ